MINVVRCLANLVLVGWLLFVSLHPALATGSDDVPDQGGTTLFLPVVAYTPHTGTIDPAIPPDPIMVAPVLDASFATDFAAATAFLYQGASPIQTGVAPNAINARRVAVLRGLVNDRDGAPLPGVRITALDHPQWGQTATRADGAFDFAVNGGGVLVVHYEKPGYLPVQRRVRTPWQEYVTLPAVVMTRLDATVTPIDLGANAEMQVARGSAVQDEDGERQSTLIFPAATTAQMRLPTGTQQPLFTASVRATEFTVGARGPQAMPAQLPPQSGYTYAVEFTVDEALAAGAVDVQFSQPIYHYVENFLGFPTGTAVPSGYYDRVQAKWIPAPDGRVIQILSIINGRAVLDSDGDNLPDNGVALGVTDVERGQLAQLYGAGQSLWRVPISHFTPWDHNWPYGPPDDAEPPQQPFPNPDTPEEDPCEQDGSIIECQNQILGERVPIVGSPFTLNYRSSRQLGYLAAQVVDIQLSGDQVPPSLLRIHLDVSFAGQHFSRTLAPAPNQVLTLQWDGRDAYARRQQGVQSVSVELAYVYPAHYRAPGAEFDRSFADFGDVQFAGNPARQEITIRQRWSDQARFNFLTWDARAVGLGGWTLSPHHWYDPADGLLLKGDGSLRRVNDVPLIIETVAGSGGQPLNDSQLNLGGSALDANLGRIDDVVVAPDGSLYINAFTAARIVRVASDGAITSFAGGGTTLPQDGVPAADLNLGGLGHMALDREGRVYVVVGNLIGRIGPDLVFRVVGGNGQPCLGNVCGDGGQATEAQFDQGGIAIAPDGSLYVADGARIRRIGTDGIVTTIAGQIGQTCLPANRPCGDGGPASAALLRIPSGISFGPDGDIYIADSGTHSIRHIDPSGTITTVAGSGVAGYSGDGGQATAARLNKPTDVAVGSNGELLIADEDNYVIRQVRTDGIISTIAGMGQQAGYSGDNGAATDARLNGILEIDIGPDGRLYVADGGNFRIRRVRPQLALLQGNELTIASTDGRQLYVFDANGRHLRTLHARTGAPLYQFEYTDSGYLRAVRDGDNNVTTIERDANSNPTAIVGPFGQRTTLGLDANGYLNAITNPAGERYTFAYHPDGPAGGGLLASITDPRANQTQLAYDELGRLAQTTDPTGAHTSLLRVENPTGFAVTLKQAGAQTTTYQVDHLAGQQTRWLTLLPGGAQSSMHTAIDGSRQITDAVGTVLASTLTASPRWGMQAPLLAQLQVTTPNQLVYTRLHSQHVRLADPTDLSSLQALTDTVTLNSRTYTSTFEAQSRTLTNVSPAGRQSTIVLDEQERITSIAIPGFAVQRVAYDEQGRWQMVTHHEGAGARTLTFSYDGQGLPAQITDPVQRSVQLLWDASGRMTQLRYPDGRAARWAYDASGNIVSITPPGQPPHTFTYTVRDQVATYTAPSVGGAAPVTRYRYSPGGQLASIERQDGATLALGYDGAGRLQSLNLARGDITFEYDSTTGQMASVRAPEGARVDYGYDGDLVTAFTWTGPITGRVTGDYDADFRLIAQRINDSHQAIFAYDADGLLITAGDLVLARDGQNGHLQATTLGAIRDEWTYNEFGELTAYEAKFNDTVLFALRYTRDKLGRILSYTETISNDASTMVFSYDLAGNLATIGQDGAPAVIFTYDSNGNRLSQGGFGGDVSGVYDAQDRLLQYGDATYTYTANGELRTKTENGETTTYTYDELGNLTSVALPDGDQIDYVIDGQNRRIGKRVDGNLVHAYLYQDAINPVAQLDAAGNVVSRFVYGVRDHVPAYMVRDGSTYRILTDALGSPRLVVDVATGAVAQRLDYDTFGNVILDSNSGFQPFGFAGGLYDEQTGLTRFGWRDYDAHTGRWTTKDPIQFAGGMNFYTYVHNDPINYIDPVGLAKPTKPAEIIERLPNNIVDPAEVPDPSTEITEIQPVRTPGTAPGLGDVVPDEWKFDPQNPENVDTEPMICPAPDPDDKKRRAADLEEACAGAGPGSDACLLLQQDLLAPIVLPTPALGPTPLPAGPTLPVRIPLRFPTPVFGIP